MKNLVVSLAIITSCLLASMIVTNAESLPNIRLGMTRSEVIAIEGADYGEDSASEISYVRSMFGWPCAIGYLFSNECLDRIHYPYQCISEPGH